jgi:hypothetical protein
MNMHKTLIRGAGIMLLPLALGLAGCGSDDDDSNDDDSSTPEEPVEPAPPPPEPKEGTINGVWDGTFSIETTGQEKNYDVRMLFYIPEGLERGTTGGAAFGEAPNDPEEPHFLFEGGYQYSADPIESDPLKDNEVIACEGDVWAVGRFGSQGSFIQEFSYLTGSAAGPDQRGAGCLYLDGNKLTGSIKFEQVGQLNVDLTYSEENERSTGVADLQSGGLQDDEEYHLWTNDNSGTRMQLATLDNSAVGTGILDVTVTEEHPTASCVGNVRINEVPDLNLFTLETLAPLAGCTQILGSGFYNVDLDYTGLGSLVDADPNDDEENLVFVHLMGSSGGGEGNTAQALYNQFEPEP